MPAVLPTDQRFFTRLNALIDIGLAFVTMITAYWLRFYVLPDGVLNYDVWVYLVMATAYALAHNVLVNIMNISPFATSVRAYVLLSRIVFAEILCLLLMITALYVLHLEEASRVTLFIHFALYSMLLSAKCLIERGILRGRYRHGLHQKDLLIIGDGPAARNFVDVVHKHPEFGYRIAGYCARSDAWADERRLGDLDDVEAVLKRVSPSEAIIALQPEDYPNIIPLITACEKSGSFLRIIPCYDEHISSKMKVDTIEGVNVEDIRAVPLLSPGNAFVKRTMDIVFSLLIIALCSPLMLVAAIGIKLTSPGPILFRQERVGKDKKPFMMLKFRSMRVNDDQDAWSRAADARRTVFGSILRKLSIDELPQFFNILDGSMSIVGPRPEIPFYVEQFGEQIPLYMIKHFVKPGITGWAQVHGLRGDTDIEARIRHDIHYIENWSAGLDLRIMLLTFARLVNDEKIVNASKKRTKSTIDKEQ
jgi:Undecaprenyl-phosphate glucose phosphotransferase